MGKKLNKPPWDPLLFPSPVTFLTNPKTIGAVVSKAWVQKPPRLERTTPAAMRSQKGNALVSQFPEESLACRADNASIRRSDSRM